MYVFKSYLSIYISCMVTTIIQALLSLGSDGQLCKFFFLESRKFIILISDYNLKIFTD